MPRFAPRLTIGAAARETGVNVPVLRSWEQRYGFPTPERSASGHRRYAAEQVEQIRQVVRDRAAGMSLDAAIARARATGRSAETSIFAGLRRRFPYLPVHVLSKRAMLAVSRAIEDECCALAESPLLFGSFQRERFYRQSEDRWRELARTAAAAVVFAEFPGQPSHRRRPIEVALADDAPLLREWAVICDAPDAAACLAGVERPGRSRSNGRRFEAVWSVDPDVVRDAAAIAASLAAVGTPAVEVPLATQSPPDSASIVRRATAVTNRIVAYLDE
jgi:DICT domain-containing protein